MNSTEHFAKLRAAVDGGAAVAAESQVAPSHAKMESAVNTVGQCVKAEIEYPSMTNLLAVNEAIHAAHNQLRTLNAVEQKLANGQN